MWQTVEEADEDAEKQADSARREAGSKKEGWILRMNIHATTHICVFLPIFQGGCLSGRSESLNESELQNVGLHTEGQKVLLYLFLSALLLHFTTIQSLSWAKAKMKSLQDSKSLPAGRLKPVEIGLEMTNKKPGNTTHPSLGEEKALSKSY